MQETYINVSNRVAILGCHAVYFTSVNCLRNLKEAKHVWVLFPLLKTFGFSSDKFHEETNLCVTAGQILRKLPYMQNSSNLKINIYE